MLLAGCPINERHWVVKHWVKYLKRAAQYAEQPLTIAVVLPEHDTQTRNALQESCLSNEVEVFMDLMEEAPREDKRVWNSNRYAHMAELRNRLLDMVRLLEPEYFLSIDSDILLARDALPPLIADLERFDAVAGKTYLHPHQKDIVNWANNKRGGSGIIRRDTLGSFEVDCIMALKLMSKKAYWVNYSPHSQGEDFGWSKNATESGLKLGWNGFIGSKHIMHPDALHKIDRRLGW